MSIVKYVRKLIAIANFKQVFQQDNYIYIYMYIYVRIYL
jgi:hypothetical protein